MILPWDTFEKLEGDPKRNLELLVRGLVQRRYGRFGQLRSVRQQPGVEFQLRLLREGCDLGASGRVFGWQCRWYDLPKDRSLGKRRRDSIEETLKKAKAHVDGLTDFVLCLRELPQASDVTWFFALDHGVELHLWADEELDARLTGEAEILRSTFFGELVLTSEMLADAHERSVQPIRKRWLAALNVATTVEQRLRLAMLQPGSADELRAEADRLLALAAGLERGAAEIDGEALAACAARVTDDLTRAASALQAVADACDEHRPADAHAALMTDLRPATAVRDLRVLARRLRAQRIPAALDASSAEAELRHALGLQARHRDLVEAQLVAVVGDAGRGKSHLGAQLTAPPGASPAGVFIRGALLRAGGTLDDLAERIPGLPVASFDELLEAVDAAGARAGARLPIVIDGLNEAQRPVEWRALLAEAEPALRRYPNVLLVVTLRGSVREQALSDAALELRLDWDRSEVDEAIERYFAHYLIDPGNARLPRWLFSQPLLLWMYCEATNPERTHTVGVERLPQSLVAVFELYRDTAVRRLADDLGLRQQFIVHQLARIARELWDRGARDLPFEEVQGVLGEDPAAWETSLVRALEDEGILFRDDREGWERQRSAVLFDLFAGYLIADALLRDLGVDGVLELLESDALWTKLRGGSDARHPLGGDVLFALVGLVPRRLHRRHLWPFAPQEARRQVVAMTSDVESEFLDDDTVKALEELIRTWRPGPYRRGRHLFDRLWEVRDGPAHRLNARFLDRALRGMPMAERDLRWTEWVRAHADGLREDLAAAEERWAAIDARRDGDDLDALAIAWLQTSTDRPLRDRATRALVRYGRPDAGRLFGLTTRMLDVDDPYVAERMLAACLGAASAHQVADPGGPFPRALGELLEVLRARLAAPDAEAPTSHRLIREYASSLFELAAVLHPAALPEGMSAEVSFAPGPTPESILEGDARASECDRTFGMDFENYIVGSTFENRGNHDMGHPGLVAALGEIRGRVWELGWREERFGEIDDAIAESDWRAGRAERPDRTERYGKKYDWIAYHELVGRLEDRGEITYRGRGGRGPRLDIDPTFPAEPPPADAALPAWTNGGVDDQGWYLEGPTEVPDALVAPQAVNGVDGPWLLVDGFLRRHDRLTGRRVYGWARGFLIDPAVADGVVELLREKVASNHHFVPRIPEDIETFAGEAPWSAGFLARGRLWDDRQPYDDVLRENWSEPGIDVELLAHEYGFSSSRTSTVEASGHSMASALFAGALGLRQLPGSLDLTELDGTAAALSVGAPEGYEGHLMYLRRDLLARYAAGRRLAQVVWGEREIHFERNDVPAWVREGWRTQANYWHRIDVVDLSRE